MHNNMIHEWSFISIHTELGETAIVKRMFNDSLYN